jgi:hypothetical protein
MRPEEAGAAAALALRLGLELEEVVAAVVAAGADVIPAEHAASENAIAPAATATVTFRYVFTALNLERRLARRIAFVSQNCNTGPKPGIAAPVQRRFPVPAQPGARGPGPRATHPVRIICFDACRIRVLSA